jgi:hypothetical protein
MKIFNYIFCFLFIVFAALQYNDPDPYIWMPIYLYSAALCYFAARNKFYPGAYAAGILVYLVYALFLFFDKTGVLNWAKEHHAENIAQSMQATKPWIEESREFFGLLIVIAVLVFNWIYSARLTKTGKQC